MENLFSSVKKSHQQRTKLQNLSPEKFGKAAFSALTFTPSKLAQNVLFKDLSNQKKLEQGSSKLRQVQALNGIFQDRLSQLQQQKEGIQKTFGEQISMYKKMLREKQQKNQKRIKSIQESFNSQIKRILNEKQEQAKFAQSQKQNLEDKIGELQEILASLRDQIDNLGGNHENLKNQNQKLQIIQDSLNKRLEESQNAMKNNQARYKSEIDELKKQYFSSQLEWQKKLDKQIQAKNKQIENMDRLHRTQLQKVQNKRVQQALLKNQELKDLAATFQKQTARLNSIISKKQELAAQLNKAIEAEKQKAFNISKNYENEINNLSHQKSRLKQQLIKVERKLQKLTTESQETQETLSSQNSRLQAQSAQLKKDLEYSQIGFMRQVDKNNFTIEQLSKQIARLRVENQQISSMTNQNGGLHRQLRNMKQLLIESSIEMQRCKQQFIRIGREKDILIVKLRQIGIQNQTLYRIKNQRQEEARGWRQSYFIQKAQY